MKVVGCFPPLLRCLPLFFFCYSALCVPLFLLLPAYVLHLCSLCCTVPEGAAADDPWTLRPSKGDATEAPPALAVKVVYCRRYWN
ncbi:unnamed protein product [Cuscuta campestris]|uniref:Uncharacterized protein n=1 Tax=Cuscuta campestris TaxID=132261 RepID=A0A484NII7_9ASTE|nr:unnamed protein product [Cuscuta campestris]